MTNNNSPIKTPTFNQESSGQFQKIINLQDCKSSDSNIDDEKSNSNSLNNENYDKFDDIIINQETNYIPSSLKTPESSLKKLYRVKYRKNNEYSLDKDNNTIELKKSLTGNITQKIFNNAPNRVLSQNISEDILIPISKYSF